MSAQLLSTLTSVLGRSGRHASAPERDRFADVRMAGAPDKRVTQAEIQQSVQRFAGDLMERITEGGAALAGTTGKTRRATLRQILVYCATVLEIATEPIPELALLDMNVFLALSGDVLRRHWIPDVFGDAGKPLLGAFDRAADELRGINARVLKPEIQAQLTRLIEEWERDNPERVRIESVRLQDFLGGNGKTARQRANETRTLLGEVKASIKAVDDALLLADRAMFLAQREPFLIRLQARLGVSEIVDDSLTELSALNALLKRARALLEQLRVTMATGLPDAALLVERRVDHFVRRCVLYLAALGAVWSLLFWGGYCVAKRLTRIDPATPGRVMERPRP